MNVDVGGVRYLCPSGMTVADGLAVAGYPLVRVRVPDTLPPGKPGLQQEKGLGMAIATDRRWLRPWAVPAAGPLAGSLVHH